MGTPIPPNEPSLACPVCWGPGKPFGSGPVPRVIEVRLTRLLQGHFGSTEEDDFLLVTHYLITDAITCTWAIDDASFLWTLTFNIQFTSLEVRRNSDNRQAFVDDMPDPCSLDFPNFLQVPANNVTFGGFANLTWDPGDLK